MGSSPGSTTPPGSSHPSLIDHVTMRAEDEEPVLAVEHERNRRSGNYYPIVPEAVPGRRSNVLHFAHAVCVRRTRCDANGRSRNGPVAECPRVMRLGNWQFPTLDHCTDEGVKLIVLGVILIIIGAVTGISILYTIGAILAVVGLVLTLLGAVGRGVGGRKTYF